MTRSGRPGLDCPVEAGAAPFSAPLASAADADPAPNAALRAPRRARRAAGAVRRLGDAGAVRGRDPGAPGRAQRLPACSTSRTWASSRSRARGAREFLQSLLSNDVERLEPGLRPVHAADERARRDRRRPDRLPARRRAVPPDRERLEPRAPTSRWLKERETRGSDVRDVSDEYALIAVQGPRSLERLGLPDAPAFTFEMGEIDGVELHGQPHGLHRRAGRRAARRRRRGRRALGRASSSAAPSRAGSARATRCGSRSATRCTATTSRPRPTRSRPASAGSARSTRSSPAPTSCGGSRRPGPSASSSRS